jgi:hypothetical protein
MGSPRKNEGAGEEPTYDAEAFKTALDTRNMEIGLFWQRSNYFLVLNTAIAAGFFVLIGRNATLAVLLGLFGAWVSFLWVCVNLGSKYWQSRWERRLEIIEEEVYGDDFDFFATTRETTDCDVARSLVSRRPKQPRAGRVREIARAARRRLSRRYQKLVLKKPSVSLTMTILSMSFVVFWVVAVIAYWVCLLRGI